MNKWVMGSIGLMLLGIGAVLAPVLAQVPTLFLTTLTGNEQINVIEPTASGTLVTGPQIVSITANTMRNTTGYQISALTTGTVVTTVATDNLLLTGAVTTLTVDLPPSPGDGALFSLNNATSSNFSGTITVAVTDGSTISNGSTAVNLGSAGSQEWQYVRPTTTWYRLR